MSNGAAIGKIGSKFVIPADASSCASNLFQHGTVLYKLLAMHFQLHTAEENIFFILKSSL